MGTCSARNMEFVESLGAQRLHDYKSVTPADLPEATDVLLDAAAKLKFSTWKRRLAPSGTWITLLPSPAFLAAKLTTLLSSQAIRLCMVQPTAADLQQLAELLQTQTITVPLAATKPFQ